MNTSSNPSPQTGSLVRLDGDPAGEMAFVPSPLPEQIQLSPSTLNKTCEACYAVGYLAGYFTNGPRPELLQSAFKVQEALASSRIEGTVASMFEVLVALQAQATEHTAPAVNDDVAEVLSCLDAMEIGRARLAELPISRRLLRETHAALMDQPRGAGKAAGEFRRIQNRIVSVDPLGNMTTKHIPPPVPQMEEALDVLERYINTPNNVPTLIAIGLAHYQFEAIHPFIDGNGRSGRLLIMLQLLEEKMLGFPVLPISSAIFESRRLYYNGLQSVRELDTFDAWIDYFLDTVLVQAEKSTQQAKELRELLERYQAMLESDLPRADKLTDLIFENPILTAARIRHSLGADDTIARILLKRLQDLEIIRPLADRDGRSDQQLYAAHEIFKTFAPDEVLDFAEWA